MIGKPTWACSRPWQPSALPAANPEPSRRAICEPPEFDELLATNSFRRGLLPATSSQDVWPATLLLCACLFFVDVLIRRVVIGWEWWQKFESWIVTPAVPPGNHRRGRCTPRTLADPQSRNCRRDRRTPSGGALRAGSRVLGRCRSRWTKSCSKPPRISRLPRPAPLDRRA